MRMDVEQLPKNQAPFLKPCSCESQRVRTVSVWMYIYARLPTRLHTDTVGLGVSQLV